MSEYIDREALLAYIEDYACNVCRKYNIDHDKMRCNFCFFGFCIDGINKQKAADVKPVVHGHWIVRRGNYNEEFECGVCRHISKDGGNYCSHCGARMDEE